MRQMRKTAISRLAFITFLMILLTFTIIHNTSFDERAVKSQFYFSIDAVEKLYGFHDELDGMYYNQYFSNKADVEEFLKPYLLESASEKVIDALYQSTEEELIYGEDIQQYIKAARQNRKETQNCKKVSYYSFISDSLLNPGLKLIPKNELKLSEVGDQLVLHVNDYSVQFYEGDQYYSSQHFSERGYPPSEKISFKMTFIEEENEWKMKEYRIETKNG
ncbi:hypothetical protein ACM26V_12660 [Salipaludibacillus sp. HK11]|uniref:hypothetical protein n=1 Tax=Salipaludibacillus sp. HK11 TaxID=3394320 RepID=UPI0039FD8983